MPARSRLPASSSAAAIDSSTGAEHDADQHGHDQQRAQAGNVSGAGPSSAPGGAGSARQPARDRPVQHRAGRRASPAITTSACAACADRDQAREHQRAADERQLLRGRVDGEDAARGSSDSSGVIRPRGERAERWQRGAGSGASTSSAITGSVSAPATEPDQGDGAERRTDQEHARRAEPVGQAADHRRGDRQPETYAPAASPARS